MEILEKKLGVKGEVLIPKNWREEFNLRTGSHILLEKTMHGIVIKPEIKNPVEELSKLNLRLGNKNSVDLVREIREEIEKDLEKLTK